MHGHKPLPSGWCIGGRVPLAHSQGLRHLSMPRALRLCLDELRSNLVADGPCRGLLILFRFLPPSFPALSSSLLSRHLDPLLASRSENPMRWLCLPRLSVVLFSEPHWVISSLFPLPSPSLSLWGTSGSPSPGTLPFHACFLGHTKSSPRKGLV